MTQEAFDTRWQRPVAVAADVRRRYGPLASFLNAVYLRPAIAPADNPWGEKARPIFPERCTVPSSYARAFVRNRGPMPAPSSYQPAGPEVEARLLQAVAGWLPTQGVYRFDPRYADSLAAQPLRGEIPLPLLRQLPDRCIYVEAPPLHFNNVTLRGAFAYFDAVTRFEYDAEHESLSQERLVVMLDLGRTWQPLVVDIATEGVTFLEAFNEGVTSFEADLRQAGATEAAIARDVEDFSGKYRTFGVPILAMILSICHQTHLQREAACLTSRRWPARQVFTATTLEFASTFQPVIWTVGAHAGAERPPRPGSLGGQAPAGRQNAPGPTGGSWVGLRASNAAIQPTRAAPPRTAPPAQPTPQHPPDSIDMVESQWPVSQMP